MENSTIALFGEAEKGEYRTAYYCRTLDEFESCFGNPPPDSLGVYYAVQALLFRYNLIFFRVREEGYSEQDYLLGLDLLKNTRHAAPVSAVCVPGAGSSHIIQAFIPFCHVNHSILIMSQGDLYDYLTDHVA